MTAVEDEYPFGRAHLITMATARHQTGGAIKVDEGVTAGALYVLECEIPPRFLGTPHTHEHEDQVAYVLSGRLGFRVGDEEFDAPARSALYKPRGISHTTFNVTSEPAEMLEITVPGRLQRYFDELDILFAEYGEVDPTRLSTMRANYGLTLQLDLIPTMERRLGITWPKNTF